MALIRLNNQSLTAVSALPAGITTGSVLQVVSVSSSANNSYTSSTYADTAYTLNITPSSTNSKILALWNAEVTVQGDTSFYLRLTRGGSSVVVPFEGAGNFGSSNQHGGSYSFNYLDSPSSTSELTYVVQVKEQSGGTIRITGEGGTGSLTLMEIAG